MFRVSKLTCLFSTHDIRIVKCCKFLLLTFSRFKSHYCSLGLDSSASAKEIKSAYYKLSFKHHPDKNNNNPESVEKFREITEAYEVLSCPRKKSEYDRKHLRPEYYTDISARHYWDRPSKSAKYSGKTRDFDYDEHFKRHYEDYEQKLRDEHEYFKMRWRAHSRRYDSPEINKEKAQYYARYSERKKMYIRRSVVYFTTMWIIFIFMNILSYSYEADRPKKNLYYEVGKKIKEENTN